LLDEAFSIRTWFFDPAILTFCIEIGLLFYLHNSEPEPEPVPEPVPAILDLSIDGKVWFCDQSSKVGREPANDDGACMEK